MDCRSKRSVEKVVLKNLSYSELLIRKGAEFIISWRFVSTLENLELKYLGFCFKVAKARHRPKPANEISTCLEPPSFSTSKQPINYESLLKPHHEVFVGY